ncbi:transient receptor potential cation channel subfamily A member 1-like [Amphiura filiformis]|uniref:transient receptor potential cation channel subfamily A member 1-like n=1 Tax=Amphiura filiformis TaxID=82378 RepID=UPI003B21A236
MPERLPMFNSGGCTISIGVCLDAGAPPDVQQVGLNTVLHSAVSGGCTISIGVCLDAGAPPDVQQVGLNTVLHSAVSGGCIISIGVCLDAGAPPDVQQGAELDAIDKNGRTPLLLSTSRGAWRTASFLIQRGASHMNKDYQSRNLMHLVVLSGGNINIFGVEIAEKRGMHQLINETDDLGHTPMHYATRDGNIKSLQGLLELGATVNLKNKQDKQSPLHFAARYGRFNSCKRLLDSIGPYIINDTDGKGMTALHIAAWNGHSKVIQLLMLRGALLHRDHAGRTPLHLASMAGNIDCMRVLLSTHSYLLDQVDRQGESALHVAAHEGQAKAVGYLLTAGASLSLNHKEETVFDIVIDEKNDDVAVAMIMHDRWHETLNNYSSNMGRCPIVMLTEHMPEIMMKVLDRCVTVSEHDPASADFWVNYDFRYLEGPISTRIEFKKSTGMDMPPLPALNVSSYSLFQVNYDFRYLEGPISTRIEFKKSTGMDMPPLPALNAMVQHNQVDLLSHPLCIEYLNSKWSAYGGPIHYSYMTIFLLFVTLFTYVIACVNPTPIMQEDGTVSHNGNGTSAETQFKYVGQHIALAYIVIYACLNIIKEFAQMFSQGSAYFTSTQNYGECILYVCTLMFVLPFWVGVYSHYQWAAGSIAIFFAWFNLLMYQERIDRIGIFIVMFIEILKSILQVMVVFSVIIIAFGLSFYMLMSGEINHAFKTPVISIFRVFSMMMGEIDFINSFVAPLTDNDPATLHYSYLSYIFLVAIVILLPILLMNLLIGLAVGDIEAVQRNAKLKRLAMQVNLHSEYEPKLPAKILEYVTKDHITIRPNACSSGTSFRGIFDKIKRKYIQRTDGNLRIQTLLELKRNAESPGTMGKLKQRMKSLSSKLDKQHDLLRLIVQKMEINTEADEQDEGEAPPGGDNQGIRMRLHMSSVVTAAVYSRRLHNKNKDAGMSVTPTTKSPMSNDAPHQATARDILLGSFNSPVHSIPVPELP